MNETEILKERYSLVMDRIREISGEHASEDGTGSFFRFCAEFLLLIDDTISFLEKGGLKTASMEELEQRNQALYADILPEHYGESYANPTYAVKQLGEELGTGLCFLYAELRSLICFAYEGRLEELVIRMELFMEVCERLCGYRCGAQDKGADGYPGLLCRTDDTGERSVGCKIFIWLWRVCQ